MALAMGLPAHHQPNHMTLGVRTTWTFLDNLSRFATYMRAGAAAATSSSSYPHKRALRQHADRGEVRRLRLAYLVQGDVLLHDCIQAGLRDLRLPERILDLVPHRLNLQRLRDLPRQPPGALEVAVRDVLEDGGQPHQGFQAPVTRQPWPVILSQTPVSARA